MSMTPSNVRNGLKTNLTTITGLRCFDIIPDSVPLPAAVVGQLDLTFDTSMARGLDTAEIEILLIVGRMSERAGQNKLDGYLAGSGSSSIKAAIEADKTLGGACSTLRVTTATAGTITNAGADMLAYRYQVEVIG
jgi:hypothetical protein